MGRIQEMIKRKMTGPPVTTGSGNVFADLGLPNPEEHLVKADLVFRIGEIIRRRCARRRCWD